MRRSHWLMLFLGTLACSGTIQSPQAQSTDPSTFQSGVVVTKLAQPIYPSLALRARMQGDVEITVGVRKDGSVESASVASGHPVLVTAALQSAQNSEYECRRCGEAVTSYSLIYTFRIEVNPRSTAGSPVTRLGNHVTVTDEPPTISTEISDSFRIRSAKCLYLWKCGFR